jgi:ABC-type glycerol-3-phosphate transport system substrate-binding protein
MGVMLANGGGVFDETGTCIIADKANLETFEPLRKAVVAGAIPGSSGLPEGVDPFAGGLLPMFMNGSWYAAGAEAAIADKFEWTILPLPKGTTGKRELATAGGGWSLSSQAKNPEQSWEFLAYLGSAEGLGSLPYAKASALTARTTDTFAETIFPPIGDDAAAISYPETWSSYETAWGNRMPKLFDEDDAMSVLTLIQEESNR